MRHSELILVFDKDKTRLGKLEEALGDVYDILPILGPYSLPKDHSNAVAMVIDPDVQKELTTLAIELLKEKRIPIFVWAPIGKPPSAWEYNLPVHVLQSPPSERSIREKMVPILESGNQRLIILATSDDKLSNTLATRFVDKGFEVRRALNRGRLEELIKDHRDETAMIFADLEMSHDLAGIDNRGPRIPLIINLSSFGSSNLTPIKLEPLVTIVNSQIGTDSLIETIETAITTGEQALIREAASHIVRQEAVQNHKMSDRLVELLMAETKNEIEETRAREFNVLNARTMGLIDEFFDNLSTAMEKSTILMETLDTPELNEELFAINSRLANAKEILDALNAVDWYRSDGAQEPIAIKKLIAEAVGILKANRRRKDVEWIIDTENTGTAICSRKHVVEIIISILTNSYESFGDEGTIMISTTSDANWNYIEIADNGTGIPAEIIDEVTKPFFTTKTHTHKGLGLTVAKGVVNTHGGDFSISSNGTGTLVKFSLPRVREGKALLAESENPDVMLIAPAKSLGYLQAMLTRNKLSVVVYDNIGESIHALKRIYPKLILVQAGMEFMDAGGVKMLANVKGRSRLTLLDPKNTIQKDVNGVDTFLREAYPAHHLISILLAEIDSIEDQEQVEETV